MFQICVHDQIIERKKPKLHSWTFFKMQWLGTLKYIIFLILLGFLNLWNLIHLFIKNNLWNENVHLIVSYDFSKFDESKKIKVWHSWWYHPRMSLPFSMFHIFWNLNNIKNVVYFDVLNHCIFKMFQKCNISSFLWFFLSWTQIWNRIWKFYWEFFS